MAAPQPTTLKILHGNPGRRPINDREPQPDQVVTDLAPPKVLGRAGKKVWRDTLPVLRRMRVLTEADSDTLQNYCLCMEQVLECQKVLKKHGRTYEVVNEKTGAVAFKYRPEAKLMAEYLKEARQLGALLGLDPSNRSRLKVPAPSDSRRGPTPKPKIMPERSHQAADHSCPGGRQTPKTPFTQPRSDVRGDGNPKPGADPDGHGDRRLR